MKSNSWFVIDAPFLPNRIYRIYIFFCLIKRNKNQGLIDFLTAETIENTKQNKLASLKQCFVFNVF